MESKIRRILDMKKNVIIFGAAGTGQKIFNRIKDIHNVICFSENNKEMWGGVIQGVPIIPPDEILNVDFDYIYIGSMCGLDQITRQLLDMGIPEYRLVKGDAEIQIKARRLFLDRFAELCPKDKDGAVAEAGVFQGDFAKEINRNFPDRKLYLFDTFEGFPDRDVKMEKTESMTEADYLKKTSVELVLGKMPAREMCIVCQGFFPDTVDGINEKFVFVSLDMDLYKPTLEGLRFFYPRMVEGGIIALHDYFSNAYPNVRQAVSDYQEEVKEQMRLCPIGDDISIAIIK